MRYRGQESTLNLAGSPTGDKRSVETRAAAAILAAYEGWRQGFEEITGRARERFERRDWRGAQADATARLALYRIHLDNAVTDVRDLLDDALMERTLWAAMKAHHARALAQRGDAEIGQTFFNSVSRRVFSTVGVDAAIEYLDPDSAPEAAAAPTERYGPGIPDGAALRRLLESYPWSVPWAQAERDAELVAAQIRRRLGETGLDGPTTIEMLRPVFYRNKGAYLIGRILAGGVVLPLVLPLIHAERGIVVDAVLMTQNEASVVFGFSWTYFRVEAPHPRTLVEFLGSIMPNKRLDELYTAIGYNKHGKTVLYRSLMEHLENPAARFAFAEGDEGMVMAV
ncbi:MAG: isocitrate dehydrogenase kinase/phosphatase AceK regulatory subunit, partial [Gemmatimonadales bacterium]